MRVAIHQPHYFPWLGYFDKLKQSDIFVLLDEVQLEKGSYMTRNRVLDNNGKIKYLTITCNTENYLDKRYRDIATKDNEIWISKQRNCIANYYRSARYFNDGVELLGAFFQNDYNTAFQWTNESIATICRTFGISTKIVLQSEIDYDRANKRSDLVLAICDALNATEYYSGRGGSVDYLDIAEFNNRGINVVFQDYSHPEYRQVGSNVFIPGLSIIDAIMNCGINRVEEFINIR